MDNLDRLFRHLVRTIETRNPEYLSRPFEVGELYQRILPYRLHRRELGFDTNRDYEMALLELLSGARGYLVVDERMRDTLRQELASDAPDGGVLREFASSHVALASDAVRRLDTPEGREPPRAPGAVEAPRPGAHAPTPRPTPAPTPRSAAGGPPRTITVGPSEPCRFCGGVLPPGRQITFCPHCGQNLTVVNCAACGTELELGWTYCTTCGRPVAPE